MRKITKYLAGVIAAALTIGTSAFAAEYSVTPVQATWYTNNQTVICSDADANTVVVPTCDSNIPVNIIGVTSNGFWQVQLDQVYYIPGAGLSAQTNDNAVVNTAASDANTTVVSNGHVNNWTSASQYANTDFYIDARNELEKQYAAGSKHLTYTVTVDDAKSLIMNSVIDDMVSSYTNIVAPINRASQFDSRTTIVEPEWIQINKGNGTPAFKLVNGIYSCTYGLNVK